MIEVNVIKQEPEMAQEEYIIHQQNLLDDENQGNEPMETEFLKVEPLIVIKEEDNNDQNVLDNSSGNLPYHPSYEMESISGPEENKKNTLVGTSVSSQTTGTPSKGSESYNPWPYLEKYFEYLGPKDEQNLKFNCLLCLPTRNSLSTSNKSQNNLKRHISRRHLDFQNKFDLCVKEGVELQKRMKRRGDVQERLDEKKPRTMVRSDVSEATGGAYKVSKAVFEEKLIALFVDNLLPLTIVDSDSWKDFINTYVPGQPLLSTKMLERHIQDRFDKKRQNLKNVIDTLQWVSTTADIWTSSQKSYMGMTVQWIEPDSLVRRQSVLSCTPLPGRPTFDLVAKEIYKVHLDFAIEAKVCSTTTDNGRNLIKAFNVFGSLDEEVAEKVQEEKGGVTVIQVEDLASILEAGATEDAEYVLPKLFRCAAHILSLVATVDADNALKQSASYRKVYRSAFAKATQLWDKQSTSSQASDVIKDEIGMLLAVPTMTRWTSVYDGVSHLVFVFGDRKKLQGLHRACSTLGMPSFSPGDINFFKEYVEVMKPVCKALDILQEGDKAYLGTLLPTLAISLKMLRDVEESNAVKLCHPLVVALKAGIKTRFGHLFEDIDFLVAAAMHPQFKLGWVRMVDGDVMQDMEGVTDKVKKHLVCLLNKMLISSGEEASSSESEYEYDSEDFFGALYECGEKRRDTGTKLIEKFLNERPVKKKPFVLNKALFPSPFLKDLFIKCNAPIPSSAAVTSPFCVGKNALRATRAGLSDRHFLMLVFLNGN